VLAHENDPKQTVIDQIEVQLKLFTGYGSVSSMLKGTERLASMLGARNDAISLLACLGITIWDTILCHNHGLDEELHRDLGEVDAVEAMLVEQVNIELASNASSAQDWYEGLLLEHIEDGRASLRNRWVHLFDHEEVHEYFGRARPLLHDKHSWRVANLLMEKVVSTRLPPELVEMVREGYLLQ